MYIVKAVRVPSLCLHLCPTIRIRISGVITRIERRDRQLPAQSQQLTTKTNCVLCIHNDKKNPGESTDLTSSDLDISTTSLGQHRCPGAAAGQFPSSLLKLKKARHQQKSCVVTSDTKRTRPLRYGECRHNCQLSNTGHITGPQTFIKKIGWLEKKTQFTELLKMPACQHIPSAFWPKFIEL